MFRIILPGVLLWLSLLNLSGAAQPADRGYDEPFRSQFHFTPEKNWMNDPNGLVWYKGEYHLFYQYNPFGNVWGHMSWGHAVSKDLIHWQHLPVALAEENGVMIFSGSAVVDWDNTSGLCHSADPSNPNDKSCLIAIYTGHVEKTSQSQHIAVSNDRGRTWTKYAGNPVLDIGEKDFRDPKVFWHEATKKWVMAVSLSKAQKVHFYGSPDLKKWELLSEFGPAGVKRDDILWECPDLFELPVDGQPGKKRWVLIVNINPGGVAGGSGGQYFIGSFDGHTFMNDNPKETALFVDYGKDFYAGVTFSDVPKSDGRRILIGWMSNWQYAQIEPTSPWRTAQSIPRVLTLKQTSAGLRLWQLPITELTSLRGQFSEKRNVKLAQNEKVGTWVGNAIEIAAEFRISQTESAVLHLLSGANETLIGYDPIKRVMFIDRTRSGEVGFDPQFVGRHEAPIQVVREKIRLRAFVDHSSIELFGNDGEAVITDRIFPPPSANLTVYLYPSKARCLSLKLWKLRSIWK